MKTIFITLTLLLFSLCLKAQNDTANAIKNYQKSLQIQDNVETQGKSDALNSKKTINSKTVDLQKYTGIYVLKTYNISIVLEIRDK